MTAATYSAAIAQVFVDEGGFSNHSADPGGATNYGITIIDANKYAAEFGWIAGRKVTVADVRAMPKWFAEKVYAAKYAAKIRYNDLPAGFDYTGLDASINSGVGRFVPWSAKALGKAATTVADVVRLSNAAPDKVALIQRFWKVRLGFVQGLKTWSHFGRGWGKRIANGEVLAVKLWLTYGAALSPAVVKETLTTEAAKASNASKKSAGGATATGSAGAGTAAGSGDPTQLGVDPVMLGTGGKVALAIAAALLIALAFYFINRALLHKNRADAYAAG
ncbi:hypothetical protein KQX64_07175 [Rhodopseudomonas palustris]|nr:hypothetical protein KQX64_07175 [Rhodopseudomonas palustris]